MRWYKLLVWCLLGLKCRIFEEHNKKGIFMRGGGERLLASDEDSAACS